MDSARVSIARHAIRSSQEQIIYGDTNYDVSGHADLEQSVQGIAHISRQIRVSNHTPVYSAMTHLQGGKIQRSHSALIKDLMLCYSDSLREHYLTCSQRGDRAIPEAIRGGRRSHACDSCTAMKLGCDGRSPCKTCRQKKIECTFSRLATRKSVPERPSEGPTPEKTRPEHPSRSTSNLDRGSINFLLNFGTASFIEDSLRGMTLPPSGSSEDPTTKGRASNCREPPDYSLPLETYYGDGSLPLCEYMDWSKLDQENLWKFLNGQHSDDSQTSKVNIDPSLYSYVPVEWDLTTAQSSSMVHALLGTAVSLNIGAESLSTISVQLNVVFTPFNMTKFINNYFEFWNSHLFFQHQATFIPQTAPVSLLVAMTLMGGLHSKIQIEVKAVKYLLDLVEAYIFSLDELSLDGGIKQSLATYESAKLETWNASSMALQHLQAAINITIIQYWAGNKASNVRVANLRFNTIVTVSHSTRRGMKKLIDFDRLPGDSNSTKKGIVAKIV
jgi:hypothetical protein